MPEYYEELASMDQYLENPTITLRIVDLIQSHQVQQLRATERRMNRNTMTPKFPTLIPAAKQGTLREDQVGKMKQHSTLYSAARPKTGSKSRRRRPSLSRGRGGRQAGSKQHAASARPIKTAPHSSFTDGGIFTPEARVGAHAYTTQPLRANQQRLTQLSHRGTSGLQVPSVHSTSAFGEYASVDMAHSDSNLEHKAQRTPGEEAQAFHAARSRQRQRSGHPSRGADSLLVSGASGGFQGFAPGEFNPRSAVARPSTAPIHRRPRSAVRPSSAAAKRPSSSSGAGEPAYGLDGTQPPSLSELQQGIPGDARLDGTVAGQVDHALRGRGEFTGAVHREPSERTAPNSSAFELRIRDIQNRIEERLARYADASRRPATVHVESLSSIRGGGRQRSMAEKYRRGSSFDNLQLAPGDGSDSDDTADLLEDRPSPIKGPLRRHTRKGLPPRPSTSGAHVGLPQLSSAGRSGTVSMPTTPIVHKGGGAGVSRGGSPDSTSPQQPNFSLSLGSDLQQGGDNSTQNNSQFTVSGVPRRRGNSLPARPHTSEGSRTPVWSGTLAPPTRPARTPTSATAFPGRVMHQRSLRIMGKHASATSPQRRVQRPDPNAFRVAMLTLSADMKTGDMVLSLFDPSTAKIHKQTYGSEQLASILPVPASFHSSSHVLKYKWWEQRLHTMADNVTVDVDDDAEAITMHLHAPASTGVGSPESPSSVP